jgi:hypothetical protein
MRYGLPQGRRGLPWQRDNGAAAVAAELMRLQTGSWVGFQGLFGSENLRNIAPTRSIKRMSQYP